MIVQVYTNVLTSDFGCDSIAVLILNTEEKQIEPDVCLTCHEEWKKYSLVYAIVGIGKYAGVNKFGSAEEIYSKLSPSIGIGYELRFPKTKGLLQSRPCIGEYLRIQGLFRKQHGVYVPSDCECHNVPDISPITADLSLAYGIDFLREWPDIVIRMELEGFVSNNKTDSSNPNIKEELSRWNANASFNPSVSKYWKLRGGKEALELRAQIRLPLFNNKQRKTGYNFSVIFRPSLNKKQKEKEDKLSSQEFFPPTGKNITF